MLKLLINEIHNKIPYKECYFDLEPLHERNDIFTEKLLIFSFKLLFQNKTIEELIHIIIQKEPRLDANAAEILICDIFCGCMELYPSELKRANIPYPLYLYITTNYYRSNCSVSEIIKLWEYNKRYYSTDIKNVIIYYNIEKFLYGTNNSDYKKKMELKIKISNYFNYFDSIYDKLNYKSIHLINILNIFFHQNISLIIYNYVIYDDIILFSSDIKNNISKLITTLDICYNNYHATNYIHNKYFEHIFLTHNINKLFNHIHISIIII